MTEQLACSPKEAARILGLGQTTIWALIKVGRLRSVKIGTRRLVDVQSMRELLNPSPQTEPQQKPELRRRAAKVSGPERQQIQRENRLAAFIEARRPS